MCFHFVSCSTSLYWALMPHHLSAFPLFYPVFSGDVTSAALILCTYSKGNTEDGIQCLSQFFREWGKTRESLEAVSREQKHAEEKVNMDYCTAWVGAGRVYRNKTHENSWKLMGVDLLKSLFGFWYHFVWLNTNWHTHNLIPSWFLLSATVWNGKAYRENIFHCSIYWRLYMKGKSDTCSQSNLGGLGFADGFSAVDHTFLCFLLSFHDLGNNSSKNK